MNAAYRHSVCVRVREQVSLALDGELSQLEQRMLSTHLERCGACGSYAADVKDFTERMRNAPRHSMRRPVVVRRTRSLTGTRLQAGIAAGFALAALGLGTQLAASTESQESSLAEYAGQPNLSPPTAVFEQEQAILRVVKVGRPLPPPGSVL